MNRGDLDAHLHVSLGDFHLDVPLSVNAGQILAVMGPNGSGKTTLLRSLAGLTHLDAGFLRLGEVTWDAPAERVFLPTEQRHVGYVFQEHRLFPHLSVVDNVAFPQRVRGASPTKARHLAMGWLTRLNLHDLARRRPASLSGGQAQRVALARALCSDPGVLLLDEPMAALDAEVRGWLRADLRALTADFVGPTLLVTHDPVDALLLADQLLVLEDGRPVQCAPPAEVARRPATPWIAKLLGLTLLRGVSQGDGVVRLDQGGQLMSSDVVPSGVETLVSVAPTAISLHAQRPGVGSARNIWPGRVAGLEMLTDRVRVEVSGAPSLLVDVTPAAVADLSLSPGVDVWLSVKATEVTAWAAPVLS